MSYSNYSQDKDRTSQVYQRNNNWVLPYNNIVCGSSSTLLLPLMTAIRQVSLSKHSLLLEYTFKINSIKTSYFVSFKKKLEFHITPCLLIHLQIM